MIAAQETPYDLAGCDTEEPMAHPDFNFTGVTITNPNARNPKYEAKSLNYLENVGSIYG